MAIFEHERRNGIQIGTVGDECMQCKVNHKDEEDYESESLDYKPVYKLWINNIPRCLCLNCFKESLGQYILVDPNELKDEKEESEKPKAAQAAIKKAQANSKKKDEKKEADKDGSETA